VVQIIHLVRVRRAAPDPFSDLDGRSSGCGADPPQGRDRRHPTRSRHRSADPQLQGSRHRHTRHGGSSQSASAESPPSFG
jgi:hypothetical protein